MATKLKFYYDLMSQPSRALYIYLNLAKIPHEGFPVALRKVEHLSDTFEKINRFKVVPCIIDGDFKLSESIAIVRYLDATYATPNDLYPRDVKQRARVDEYLEWQHLNIRAGCAGFIRYQFLEPYWTGKPPDEHHLAWAKSLRDSSLQKIENLWLEDNKFIAGGDNVTIADLFAAAEIEQTKCIGYDPTDGRPRLAKWLKQVQETTDPAYTEAHKYIHIFGRRAKL